MWLMFSGSYAYQAVLFDALVYYYFALDSPRSVFPKQQGEMQQTDTVAFSCTPYDGTESKRGAVELRRVRCVELNLEMNRV